MERIPNIYEARNLMIWERRNCCPNYEPIRIVIKEKRT